MLDKQSRQKLREEKRRKRFINSIVYSAKIHIRKSYYDFGKKAVIVPCKGEKEWIKIKENINEINEILAEEKIRIELENYQLRPWEFRIVLES